MPESIVSCSNTVYAATVSSNNVTGISLSKTVDTLTVGGTDTLTATVSPSNATNKNVTWKSSNTNVVKVVNRVVTAVGSGSANITVTTADGSKSANCVVTVNNKTTTLTLTAPQTNLYKTASFSTPLTFSNGVQAALAPQIVTVVEQNGDWYYVKTSSLGNAWLNIKTPIPPLTLTAPYTNLYKTASFDISLNDPRSGKQATLAPQTVTVVEQNGDWYNIKTWLGDAWINLKNPTGVINVTGISLNKTSDILKVGGTDTLAATIAPVNASNKNITWTSSNTKVATVNNGVITAVSAGTTAITATTADKNKTATCSVTVTTTLTLTAPQTNLYKTASFDIPLTSSNGLQSELAPQIVTVISQNGDWYCINSSLGNAWLNIKTPIPPVILTAPHTNLYKTASFDTPLGGGLTPQTVTPLEQNGDWYYIKSYLGNAWFNLKNPTGVIKVTGISLNKTSDTLTVGGTDTLTATITPSNATNKNVTWTSSNTNVVKVVNGVITAVGSGTANITVTTVDGSKSAVCVVNVVYDSNSYLTQSQMKVNGQYILNYLRTQGWTKNAVCGMLGNMQVESTVNPGIWENLNKGNTSAGFGLVQWTPATKYINWANSNGLSYDNMNSELKRILYEVANGIQWINSKMTFRQFTQSTNTENNLAMLFLSSYERPANSNQPQRGTYAQDWYNVLI